jgi:hypothetical protein
LKSTAASQLVRFDSPPEIFATDTAGRFHFPLTVDGGARIDTSTFDEMRFVFSVWHPSSRRVIDLDRAYVELCWALESHEEHWVKLAEIEPVVPPYNAGETFDGWIVLPVLALASSFALTGSGFEPRARLQVRASTYLVS